MKIPSFYYYSRILLIWQAQNQTGTWLLEYLQWLNFLQVVFCYFSYIWAAQLIRQVFHLDISMYWFGVMRVLFCVFWSHHSQRRWQNRRYHNGRCTDTLSKLLNLFLRPAYSICKAFSGKKLGGLLADYSPPSVWLQGFLDYQVADDGIYYIYS
jgi:hypothetical protein